MRARRHFALVSTPARIFCGDCKATGRAHEWDNKGNLEPVHPYRPCKACLGSGYALPHLPEEKKGKP